MNKTHKKIGLLIAFALLITQLCPVHLHIHNLLHNNTNTHISSKIECNNFAADQIDHHSDATVIDFNNNLLLKNSVQDTDINPIIIFALALAFIFFIAKSVLIRQTVRYNHPPRRYFYFKPTLRAPPIIFV